MEAIVAVSNYELERQKPLPDKLHAFLQRQLLFLIQLQYRDQYEVLPEMNILFNGEKKIPDLSIYKKHTLDFTHNETNVAEIPLCAIEILSGQQVLSELTAKLEQYLAAGVQSYWLVVPELRSIYVYHTPNDSDIYGRRDVLKDTVLGIELDLKEVFEGM